MQLAGDDASIEVRLGKDDYAKRLRQALEVLDAQRGTARAPCITYVDVSQGKRAIIGTGATARYQQSAPAADAESSDTQTDESAQGASVKSAGAASKVSKKKDDKKAAARKKTDEARHTDVATRPRRVE